MNTSILNMPHIRRLDVTTLSQHKYSFCIDLTTLSVKFKVDVDSRTENLHDLSRGRYRDYLVSSLVVRSGSTTLFRTHDEIIIEDRQRHLCEKVFEGDTWLGLLLDGELDRCIPDRWMTDTRLALEVFGKLTDPELKYFDGDFAVPVRLGDNVLLNEVPSC